MERRAPTEYFTAIDGLRAFAVLAVVLSHVSALLPSGFVGVNVFFVISGFVVASAASSFPGHGFGQFVTAFYARRILRIAPALVVCVLVTFVAVTLFIPDGWLSSTNSETGFSSLFGFSNIVLLLTANDYWSPLSEFNPFTHTWSLGVEEQFYVIFPFLLFPWLTGRRKRAVAALALLGLSSLVAAWRLQRESMLAFYSLHTRFWELAIGVGLFLGITRWRPVIASAPSAVRLLLGMIGLAGLAASVVVVKIAAFPWPWALLPTSATALLLCVCVAAPGSLVARWLASPPLVYIGKRSYSLYLWHWPLTVLARWTTGVESRAAQASILAASLLLAAASYRLVECPVRFAWTTKRASNRRVVLSGVAALCVGLAIAIGLVSASRVLSLSVTRDAMVWDVNVDLPVQSARCEVTLRDREIVGGSLATFDVVGCLASGRTIFVVGDSHAAAYVAMLKVRARQSGDRVVVMVGFGCNVFTLVGPMNSGAESCRRFNVSVMDIVHRTAKAGDVLFLPALRIYRLCDQWGPLPGAPVVSQGERDAALIEAIGTLAPIARAGVRILFEAPLPIFRSPPYRCADWFNDSNPVCRGGMTIPRVQLDSLRRPVLASISAAVGQLPGAAQWDPFPLLCPGEECSAFRAGKPLFFDGDHLSGYGNEVLAPSFARGLDRLTD